MSGGGSGGALPPIGPPVPGPPPGYPAPAAQPMSWSTHIHIVYGDEDDETSGGHLAGLQRPGKSEFPPSWNEEKIAQEVTSVAALPDTARQAIDGTWRADAVRDGVTVRTYVRPDGTIATGFPLRGPGVKHNPPKRG
ncbi:MAG: EndoU domain-containing protein [Micromonosporaceae bacterium]